MKLKFLKKVLSVLLCFALVMPYLPILATAATTANGAEIFTDPGTASSWEHIMGDSLDGTRFAGRVWADKSVYKNGDVIVLDTEGRPNSTHTVALNEQNGENFQVIFSALGSSLATDESFYVNQLLDVVMVLDTSTSMEEDAGNNMARLDHMISAANGLLADLCELDGARIAIVTYNEDAHTVIGLEERNNGVVLSTNSSVYEEGNGIIFAHDNDNNLLGQDEGYERGTNLQSGIDMGMSILANADLNGEDRTPVAIVLTDGEANHAVSEDWYDLEGNRNLESEFFMNSGIVLSTLLNAAYNKTLVEKHYEADVKVYGVGVDLENGSAAHALMNPGDATVGFNASNQNDAIADAYGYYLRWRSGTSVNFSTTGMWGSSRTYWTFDHDWPSSAGVTTAEIADNINYVNDYQDVSSADLSDAFDNIYEQLATGAFNPITSSQSTGTGIQNTPFIYVDNIGKYMEVKDIQALRVFDQTYYVTKNTDGSYSIDSASGINPTTNENWSTDDVTINVVEEADGTQQLRVYINQEILPIMLDEVEINTENGVTETTLQQTMRTPLRLFYTVGVDPEILLPNGNVNIAKISADYPYINTTDGKIDLYSNEFGILNTERSPEGTIIKGDAHIGFVPSDNNRYYYHQVHHEVYKSATNLDGSEIEWEAGDYGVVVEPGKYNLQKMTYADYASMSDSDTVYTVINFIRPTADTTDGNAAEEITYLIHTDWNQLKGSLTFYDDVNDTFLNDEAAIEPENTVATLDAYIAQTGVSAENLIVEMGLYAKRITRLNNMYEVKTANNTNSAALSYAPTYSATSHDEGDVHEHSEVIVWLGNNGRLTLPISSGIKITKNVTELADGATADEAFAIYARLNMDVQNVGSIAVTDANGDVLDANKYQISVDGGDVLVTLYLANGESAIIIGAPGGTDFSVSEAEHDKYEYTYTGATTTVVGEVVEGVVTNTPIKPGALYITKEVEHSIEGEAFPTDYEFEFKVTFVDADGNPIEDDFPADNNHDPSMNELSTNAEGIMYGKLRHGETVYIKDIPAGATVTVEEINIPNNYKTQEYRSRNYSGAQADNDGVVTIHSDQNATVVVVNTYTPNPTSLDMAIKGTKHFNVVGTLETQLVGSFTFVTEQWNGTGWDEIPGKTATLNYAVGELSSDKEFNIDLGTLNFDQAGVYTYQVREKIGSVSNVTYDRTLYTFTVTVEDNGGQLEAVVTDLNNQEITNGVYEVEFNNSIHSAPVSINVIKDVEDLSENPLTSPAGFSFIAREAQVDANGVWSAVPGGATGRVYSDGAGEARFADIYEAEGTHYFLISEEDSGLPGWDYTEKVYEVEVVITKDASTNNLTANLIIDGVDQNSDNANIEFENVYAPTETSVEIDTLVDKSINGRNLNSGEFSFAIFKDGNSSFTDTTNALFVGTNDADGDVVFTATDYGVSQGFAVENGNKLIFTKVGDYFFDIVELSGNLGGVTYDQTIYDLVVEVTDNGDGTLKNNFYFEDSPNKQVIFNNTYTVEPTEVVIDGRKTLEIKRGKKTLLAGAYNFGLYNESGEKLDEATNVSDGTFKFDAIEYDAEDIGKTYKYTVKEIAPDGTTDGSYSAGGVSWSNLTFEVSVSIIDNGDGTITANTIGNGESVINFVNVYETELENIVLDGKKELLLRDLTAGEFTFALYSTDSAFANPTLKDDNITHDVQGNFIVELGTLEEGKHYFLLKENIPDQRAKGIHYSVAEYYITIDVTDNGTGKTTYTKTVVNANVPSVTDADIVFTNVYVPEPGEIPLSGRKIYNGGKALVDGAFAVALYDSEENLLQTAQVKADETFAFENLKYRAADVQNTYTYTIKEIIPEGATVNADGNYVLGNDVYDGCVYSLTVTVTDDDKDGELEIEYVLTDGTTTVNEIVFENTFVPDPIAYTPTAMKTYNKTLKADMFKFKLEGNIGGTPVAQEKFNAADGTITFDELSFTEAGTYTFKVTEINKILGFIQYSAAEYELVVTVINTNGVLSIGSVTVNDDPDGTIEFINTYAIDGEDEITLRGSKTLTGDRTQVNANEFEFGLYDAAGQLIEAVKNDATGSFAFTTLTFDETDVPVDGQKQITYTVKEIAGDNARYTYDNTVYTVVVTVEDNDEGGVSASYTVNGASSNNVEITFTNVYTNPDPVEFIPMAKKTYNKTLEDGQFKFKLEGNIGGTPVAQEKFNAADGTITFDKLTFTEAGTYTFTVTEINKILGFIQYSAAEYELVVTVVDTKGVLSIGSVTVNDDPDGTIEFINTYVIDGEDEITLQGSKTLTGGRTQVNANEFEFGLYDAAGQLIEAVKNDATGSFAFTTLTFDETDVPVDGQKQITYTVKEIAGSDIRVTYDQTVYTVVVTVKDNDEGGVSASYTVNGDATGLIEFTNVYTPKPQDITVDFDVVKTVENKGSEKIGPEGFEFLLNDGTADSKVKADENGKAKFTLTYTEDDIGKTYTYKLTEVNGGKDNVTYSTAEYTITAAIELNNNNELVATLTQNGKETTAVVAEFENVYDYTPVPPKTEHNESPKTGDNSKIYLWFALLLASGGGIFATTLYGRKRKEDE